jgi:sugar diacid utilization regulator
VRTAVGIAVSEGFPQPPSVEGDDPRDLRRQLSRLQGVLVLSMMMIASTSEEEILKLAATAVPSVSPCTLEGIYLRGGGLVSPPDRPTCPADEGRSLVAWEAALRDLGPNGGPVTVAGHAWACAYPLRAPSGALGYLLATSPRAPSPQEQFLLTVLVQQAGVALANARLLGSERAAAAQSARAVAALRESLQASERSTAIHRRLTLVAASGEGLDGIARAVHDLTGLPTAIEDEHGNLLSWGGPARPENYEKPGRARRRKVLAELERSDRPVRVGDKVLALANPREQVLGVLALLDPDGRAGEHDLVALEHGATVLAMELARLQSVAESELRLRRDLVEDLLSGTDAASALARARALGYDLEREHRVVLVEPSAITPSPTGDEALFHLVRRTAREVGIGSMIVARGGRVVVLAVGADADDRINRFHTVVAGAVGTAGVRVGVGGRCTGPEDFPRSQLEAELALKLQAAGSVAGGRVTAFDDLGLYQLLSRVEDLGDVERFMRRWLGALIEYDGTRSNAQLVQTLTQFLACGGNHDRTAEHLFVHKSTLRYRLQRIRDISGHDLTDPETLFNLQIATRAWQTLAALGG